MKRAPLHKHHRDAGATFAELFGWELPHSYGDPAAEYDAARESVAVMDRSYVGRFRVTGKDTLDLLNRLSSNKVDPLPPGTGAVTILPTNKGRVIDLLNLFARDDHLLMLTSPQTRERVAEWIDLYTFLEEVALEEITQGTAMIAVLGPQAARIVDDLLGLATANLEPYASVAVSINGFEATLLRSDPLRAPGCDILLPAQQAPDTWNALIAAGAVPIGERAFDLLRIEAGIPRYGWEMSEAVNPWEVNLQEYINFEKGCYIGQEVILRLNTYQKVQKHLMALALSNAAQVAPGHKLYLGEQQAGVVTSLAQRPTSGETIGLGLIRRAFATSGMELRVVAKGGEQIASATLGTLPTRVPVAG